MQCNKDSCCEHITGGVNMYFYVCPLVSVCLFACVCNIKSDCQQKPCLLCQTQSKLGALLHKTQKVAFGTKVPRLNKFRSFVLLSKVTH